MDYVWELRHNYWHDVNTVIYCTKEKAIDALFKKCFKELLTYYKGNEQETVELFMKMCRTFDKITDEEDFFFWKIDDKESYQIMKKPIGY